MNGQFALECLQKFSFILSLSTDETGIADPYTVEDIDELPELFDSASFGDEDEDGSGVTPRPPGPPSCKRFCPSRRRPIRCIACKCRRICRSAPLRLKRFCLRRCVCRYLCRGRRRCPPFCRRLGDQQTTAYVDDESADFSQSTIN